MPSLARGGEFFKRRAGPIPDTIRRCPAKTCFVFALLFLLTVNTLNINNRFSRLTFAKTKQIRHQRACMSVCTRAHVPPFLCFDFVLLFRCDCFGANITAASALSLAHLFYLIIRSYREIFCMFVSRRVCFDE